MIETRQLRSLRALVKRSFYGSCMGGLLCLSCAKNAPSAASASAQSDKAAQSRKAERAPLPALTPVATPQGVVARFRVLDPKKFADGLLDAASIPFDLDKMLDEYKGEYSFLQA